MAPAAVVPFASARFLSRRSTVPDTAERALTVPELEEVVAEIDDQCRAAGWKGDRLDATTNTWSTVDLTPEDVNLHDLNKLLIKPKTEAFKCSFVELVADGARTPDWFVSHSWSGPVKAFVRCLRQLITDRGLPESTTFWVCAYSNNQHDLGKDVGTRPKETSFFRALTSAKGTVAIIDEGGDLLTRVWCVYEAYLALTQTESLYDTYSPVGQDGKGGPVGITTGSVAADEWRADGMPGGAVRNKARREAPFPTEIARRGRAFDVQAAQASVQSDKDKILDEIGSNVGAVNSTVIAHYSAPSIPKLISKERTNRKQDPESGGSGDGAGLDEFVASISASQLRALSVIVDRGSGDEPDARKCKKLFAGLPTSLQRLELAHMPGSTAQWLCVPRSAGGGPPVAGLRHLALRSCHLDDSSVQALGQGLRGSDVGLELLDLSNNLIADAGMRHLKAMLAATKGEATLAVLGLSQNFIGDSGGRTLASALGSQVRLRKLSLHYNRLTNGAALAVVHAVSRHPQLEHLSLQYNWLRDTNALAATIAAELPPGRCTGVVWHKQLLMARLKMLACCGFTFVTYYLFMSAFVWTANVVATHRLFFGYSESAAVLRFATALVAVACGVSGIYTAVFLLRDARLWRSRRFYEITSGWVWDYRELYATSFFVFDVTMTLLLTSLAVVAGIGILSFQYRVANGDIDDCSGAGGSCSVTG